MNKRISTDGKKTMKLLYGYCAEKGLEDGDEFLFKPILSQDENYIATRTKTALEELVASSLIVIVEDELWFTDDGWRLAVQLF